MASSASSSKSAAAAATADRDAAWAPRVPIGHTPFSWEEKNDDDDSEAKNGNNNNGLCWSWPAPRRPGPDTGRNVLITSALPYVNNVPHLGTLVGCVLSADVYARYCRLRGYNTLYTCGSDNYGTATETKALQMGMTPAEICEKFHAVHEEIYRFFNIGFDVFGRTATEKQTEIAQDIFLKLHKNGHIEEREVPQLYCKHCERYLADRFVEGTCPNCGFEDARGDQCDSCQAQYESTELKNPRCAQCHKTDVEVHQSKHLFFRLQDFHAQLSQRVAAAEGRWSANALRETHAWIEKMRARCITRDLSWGTPIPLPGYDKKCLYVWFDAPIGYISITAGFTDDWRDWWLNPEHVRLVQFLGKDNISFHTVIFPATLIGTGDNYTPLHEISVTEFLNYESGKFSKSRSTGVFGDSAIETGIPPEVWRYYLLANRPEQSDTVFSWDDFRAKNNNELLKNLGNFINRCLSYTAKTFEGILPPTAFGDEEGANKSSLPEAELVQLLEVVDKFQQDVTAELRAYVDAFEDGIKMKRALERAMAISKLGNGFLQELQPWKLVKKDLVACGVVTAWGCQLVHLLAALLHPFMPGFADKVIAQLACAPESLAAHLHDDDDGGVRFVPRLPAGHRIGSPEPLFRQIEQAEVDEFRARFGGSPDAKEAAPDMPLRLVCGTVTGVREHPEADKCFVLDVSCGAAGNREIVSGLRAAYSADELKGQTVILVTNLKTSKIRGVQSRGMILTAKDASDALALLQPAGDVADGTPVTVSGGVKVVPKKNFNVRKHLAELGLKVLADGTAVFHDSGEYKLQVGGKDVGVDPEKKKKLRLPADIC